MRPFLLILHFDLLPILLYSALLGLSSSRCRLWLSLLLDLLLLLLGHLEWLLRQRHLWSMLDLNIL